MLKGLTIWVRPISSSDESFEEQNKVLKFYQCNWGFKVHTVQSANVEIVTQKTPREIPLQYEEKKQIQGSTRRPIPGK